jgi:capsular exopolysaccharide synthesis family protein
MRSIEHGKRSSKIHAVFQDTTETWLERPRRPEFDGVLVRKVSSRVDSQPDQPGPLAGESQQHWNGQKSIDGSQGVRAESVVAEPPSARKSRKAAPAQKGLDQRLITAHHPISPIAEQYRKLYIEIVRAGRVRELRTLLLSSALPGEGKTFSALNLALTIAATGGRQNVLLVDADFRKPSLPQLLGTSPEYGLADYLLGNVASSQLLAQTQIPGLTVVYAGRAVENPTALFSPEKIGQFFQDIKYQDQYSYIIFDSSPVLLTAEPAALVQYVDATLLVVRAGCTPRNMVAQAINLLGRENILGCVFNGVTSTDSYYYNSYYSSYYQR